VAYPPSACVGYNVFVFKYVLLIFFSVALIIGLVLLRKSSGEADFIPVNIGQTTVSVEIADTTAKRSKGLMYREYLDQDKGMLFVFPQEAPHSFWMANTKIPLDIIWISAGKEIVYINESTPPCTDVQLMRCPNYIPGSPAKYVLEVNAGWTVQNNVKVGDSADFSL